MNDQRALRASRFGQKRIRVRLFQENKYSGSQVHTPQGKGTILSIGVNLSLSEEEVAAIKTKSACADSPKYQGFRNPRRRVSFV